MTYIYRSQAHASDDQILREIRIPWVCRDVVVQDVGFGNVTNTADPCGKDWQNQVSWVKTWVLRDLVFRDVEFGDDRFRPLTHIRFRCEVPTPSVVEGQSTIIFKPHILKHHIPELPNIRESRILAPVRPRMEAAGSQRLQSSRLRLLLPTRKPALFISRYGAFPEDPLHSAKGCAVETGCSDLYGVIYYVTM